MRRTKIVATIGPASQSPATLEKMIHAGMDVVRLNFSHGTHASHAGLIRAVRKATSRAKRNIVMMADLQGPKIRVGDLPKPLKVKKGEPVTVPVTLPKLGSCLKRGTRILFDDGVLEATYVSGTKASIVVTFAQSAVINAHVGIAIPGVALKGLTMFTKKDQADAKFAIKEGVDWIVLSFVESARDITSVRAWLKRQDPETSVKICAKIERALAVKHQAGIIKASDAVMVGRGDLALDVDPAEVPLIQKGLVSACRIAGKPVIVATQMLDSMTHNRRPTRAEVSDVANAVIDHADAVMLSGETAKGEYPIETVAMMASIVTKTEASAYDDILPQRPRKDATRLQMFGVMMTELAYAGRIEQVAVRLEDASLAWEILRHRPEIRVLLLGTEVVPLRQELLRWAVTSVKVSQRVLAGGAQDVVHFLYEARQVKRGSTVTVIGYRGTDPIFETCKV